MDRSIPHIRNIFSSRKKSTSDTQDLCQYEKSPRNRKKSSKDHDNEHKTSTPRKAFDFGKENHKSSNNQGSEDHRKSRNPNYNTYTSKTLTEKDMKHLERHLSMKKTIRKQISRNLAQAFLDNPNIFEPEDEKPVKHKADHMLPQYGDKQLIPKTEQNVLDLLKVSIDDRDSGHSSPTLEDTDYDDEDADEIHNWRSSSSSKHRNSDTKGLMEDKSKHSYEPEKKSSIWKMFSPRQKGKR